MLPTHERIQLKIFSSSADTAGAEASRNGSVVEFLRQTIEHRFGVKDVPDGHFSFPSEIGGLDVQSPFVSLIQRREAAEKQPGKSIDEYFKKEREAHKEAKARFESGETTDARYQSPDPDFKPEDADAFFSSEEFVSSRKILDDGLRGAYEKLLSPPKEQGLDYDDRGVVMNAVAALSGQQNLRGISAPWYGMESYWPWVAQLGMDRRWCSALGGFSDS